MDAALDTPRPRAAASDPARPRATEPDPARAAVASGHDPGSAAADAAEARSVDATAPPRPLDGDALIAEVRRLADGPLAELADDIDRRGVYPRALLQQLGELGALRAHHTERVLPGRGADYGLAIRAMAEVSRVCGATGFMMWCHAVCGLYMERSGNPALAGAALERHASGRRLGATGMSNPMKSFAGIESLLLRARPVEGGWRVDGTLPWVSNLGPDHVLGAVAAVERATTEDRGSGPGRGHPHGQRNGAADPQEIMFLVPCDAPTVELRPCPTFSAMEGTSTWAVRLHDHRVGLEALIAAPVRPFIGRIRAAFVLLQTGMGLGVAQGAIDSMWAVERPLGHVNRFLDERPDALQAELDRLSARILALAATPFGTEREFLIDVLDARAHASELALRAAQSALLHAGARGYLMSSPVQRRVRESHFVAIVTPAIKHLRKEIARLSAEEYPA